MRKTLILISSLALLFSSCVKEELPTSTGEQETKVQTSGSFIKVKFSEELTALAEEATADGKVYTKSMELNSVFDELGITAMERIFPDAGEFEERTRREGMHQWYRISFEGTKAPVEAKQAIEGVEGVLSVEVPRKIKRMSLPNDSYFNLQWYLYNDGKANYDVKYQRQLASSNKGCDINIESVWENFTTGSSDVIVAVVDGGIDTSHPDLNGVVLTSASKNFVSNSSTITPDGHGTFVAGTIAALRNNSKGVAGIAGGDVAAGVDGVKLISCEIFEGNDVATDAQIANAIKWGADHGAVISQNSWGNYYDEDEDGYISKEELAYAKSDKIDATTKAAIDYFIKYAGCDNSGNQLADSPMKGGLVLFAAGNESIPYGVPADYEPVIAVGAIGPDWLGTYYTNYGDWVDICAPGGDGYGSGYASNYDSVGYSRGNIYNLYATVDQSKYDYEYTNYGYMMGTSMATPVVSGVAALLISYFGGQGLTPDDIKERLLKGANEDYLSSSYPIGPVVDAYGAFSLGNTPPVKSQDIGDVLLYIGGENKVFDLNKYFEDADGDAMTFALTSDPENFSASFSSSGLMTLAGTQTGLESASVRATDTEGAYAEQTFRVLVKDPNNPVDLDTDVVSGSVSIGTEEEAETTVIVTNASGKKVLEETATASGFDPMTLDLSKLAPGRYGLAVSYNGKTYYKQIVKI